MGYFPARRRALDPPGEWLELERVTSGVRSHDGAPCHRRGLPALVGDHRPAVGEHAGERRAGPGRGPPRERSPATWLEDPREPRCAAPTELLDKLSPGSIAGIGVGPAARTKSQ